VNEAFDPTKKNQFGFERLEETVLAAAPGGCQAVIRGIRDAVAEWTQGVPLHDDETLLVACRKKAKVLDTLQEARDRGKHLSLTVDLDALTEIKEWILAIPELTERSDRDKMMMESALFEVCANIIEHGYQREKEANAFDLWWLPDMRGDKSKEASGSSPPQGSFVIVDQAIPFRPETRSSREFFKHLTKTEGRGFGLELIQRAMKQVSYNPGTSEGNVTILSINSDEE
jgi:anti-sigma regulatory factor (Ser/Thr protein kinase)